MPLDIPPKDRRRWDLVSLGEVMLRLDPGDERIATTRQFRVWEGGGEYNVARGLARCFGMHTAIVTTLADNAVGRLVEDLMRQGGVALDYLRWVSSDGVGRSVRNGLNFVERGFGLRPPLGCSDRGHTAASQLAAGAVDWERIFARDGARWFHTGGIFTGLSDSTPAVARDAMEAAHRSGAIVSYDANYRPSLWQSRGGQARAGEVNRSLATHVDVLFGHDEDFAALLGRSAADHDDLHHGEHTAARFEHVAHAVLAAFPTISIVATTVRVPTSASRNDWAGLAFGGEGGEGVGCTRPSSGRASRSTTGWAGATRSRRGSSTDS